MKHRLIAPLAVAIAVSGAPLARPVTGALRLVSGLARPRFLS